MILTFFSVLITSMTNFDRHNLHKQKLFGVFNNLEESNRVPKPDSLRTTALGHSVKRARGISGPGKPCQMAISAPYREKSPQAVCPWLDPSVLPVSLCSSLSFLFL